MTAAKNTYHHGDLPNALVLTATRLIEDSPSGSTRDAMDSRLDFAVAGICRQGR
jgi:hypothetical protein